MESPNMYILPEQDSAVLMMGKVLLPTHSCAWSIVFSLPWPCCSDTVGSSHTEELSFPHSPYGLKGLDRMNIHFCFSIIGLYSVFSPCLDKTTGGGSVFLGGLCHHLPTPLAVPAQSILAAALARFFLPHRVVAESCICAGPGIFYLNGVCPALRD